MKHLARFFTGCLVVVPTILAFVYVPPKVMLCVVCFGGGGIALGIAIYVLGALILNNF